MAKPNDSIAHVQLPGENVERPIIPYKITDGINIAKAPTLGNDDVLALQTDLKYYKTTSAAANAFIVTIPHITVLEEGLVIHVKFHAATAEGATLNVNNLGAKAIYYRTATAITTHIAANNYVTLVYDATNSHWVMQFAYDSAGSNTIGYQLRTNSTVWANKTGYTMNRRTLLFEVDGGLSGTATTIATGTTKTTVNFKYIPGGVIKYYSTSGSIAVDANFGATGLWDQYAIDLRYTFNTGSTLVSNEPVYMRCVINTDGTLTPDYTGSPKHPIAQVLPTTDDGKAYVYLGKAYSTSSMELYENHPIYIFKNGKICLYTGVQSDWSASSGPTQILNKPTLGTAAAKDFTTSVTSGSSDLVTSGAVYTSVDSKADKVGPLPSYSINTDDSVLDFITNNNLEGKSFIFTFGSGNGFICVFNQYSATSYNFEIEVIGNAIRYVGTNVDLNGKDFMYILSSTYRKDYEIKNNKVTIVSETSTDTEYPSAKCLWDIEQNLRALAEGKIKAVTLSYQTTMAEIKDSLDEAIFPVYLIDSDSSGDIAQEILNGEWDSANIVNSYFNSTNSYIDYDSQGVTKAYFFFNYERKIYLIEWGHLNEFFNVGDIVYVVETLTSGGDILPDRWFDNTDPFRFYALEGKVDLTDYPKIVDVPKYQATQCIVRDALTNINGRTFQNYTATLSTSGNYTYYLIQKNSANLTKADASEYMKYMCGSEYVPTYNYDFPRNTLFIFEDNTIWKPQFDTTNGLLLYKLNNGYVTIDGAQTIAGEKTFSGGIKLNQGNSIKLNSNTNVWELVGTDNYYLNIKCNNSPQYYIDSFTIMPNLNQDLGSTAYKWKDEYLNGQLKLYNGSNQTPHYWSFGTDADYSQLRTYYDGTLYYTTNTDGILPFGNNLSLGSSYFKWKNLYLSGQLSNGTDSIYISDIQEKIAIKRYI